MRLSTKGRFAVTAMLDVALRQKSGPVSLSDISARHQISLSYLEQMFSKLRQHGFVESTRGPGGGYKLGLLADNISVADIIGAVEGDSAPIEVRTQGRADVKGTASAVVMAQDGVSDMTQDLWNTFNARLEDYMQSITLRSLVLEQLAKGFRADEPIAAQRGVFKKPKIKAEPQRKPVANSVFALAQAMGVGQPVR